MLITNFRLKYVLYKIVCGAYQLIDTGRIHPARERAMRALQRTVDYIEREMPEALGLDSQRDAIDYALRAVAVDGHYMEFGVFTGGTIRYIARCIGNKTIHGFDSFEGSPEAWSGYNLGAKTFDTKGRLPRVPKWLANNPGPVAFIHVDCNIYSSTKTILDLVAPRLASGSVILFDEYFNFPNWEQHEFKAFQEFVAAYRVKYTYLAFARQQVAVRIDAIEASNS